MDAIGSHGQQHAESGAAQFSFHQYDVSARQQRARKAIQKILTEPAGQAYGNYVVKAATASLISGICSY